MFLPPSLNGLGSNTQKAQTSAEREFPESERGATSHRTTLSQLSSFAVLHLLSRWGKKTRYNNCLYTSEGFEEVSVLSYYLPIYILFIYNYYCWWSTIADLNEPTILYFTVSVSYCCYAVAVLSGCLPCCYATPRGHSHFLSGPNNF